MNPIASFRALAHPLAAAALLLAGGAVFAQNSTATVPKMADPSQLQRGGSADSARPSVGVPLTQAESLIKAGRFAEAMAKVQEAEKATPDLTRYERYAVSRTKAAVALKLGQTAEAFDAIEAAIATDQLTGDEQTDLMASLIHAAYGAKDYARAARWADRYMQAGGRRPDVTELRASALYMSGNYAAAASAQLALVKANDDAGRPTDEQDLVLLASAQRHAHDDAGATVTIERLIKLDSKPAYWADLLSHVDQHALPERLTIDLFRLVRATGNLLKGEQHLALARLAMNAGFPAESVMVLDEAVAKGAWPSGEPAEASALRTKARKQAAEDAAAHTREEAAARSARDGNGLVMQGELALSQGRAEQGIEMMEQGLAKGGLRRADEARLRLGEAQALAGRDSAAVQTLAPLKASAGSATLAHLWALYASSPRKAVAAAAAASSASASAAGKP